MALTGRDHTKKMETLLCQGAVSFCNETGNPGMLRIMCVGSHFWGFIRINLVYFECKICKL